MALVISLSAATGLSLVATAQRASDSFWWNNSTQAYVVSPSFADKSFALAEGTVDYVGSYSGSPAASMGTEKLTIFIHDTGNSNLVVHD